MINKIVPKITTSMKYLVPCILLLWANDSFSQCWETTAWGNCITAGQVLSGTCTDHTCAPPYAPFKTDCAIATSSVVVGTEVDSPSACGRTQYI